MTEKHHTAHHGKKEAEADKEWEPKIVGFLCNWCSYAGADLCGVSRFQYPTNIRLVRVMCSTRVSPHIVLDVLEVSRERGVDHLTREGYVHARADAVWPTAPARVDQVDARAVPLQALAKHARVYVRVARHEGTREEAVEVRHRVNDAHLCARQLARVSRKEPQHRLLGRQLGDWR